MNFSNQDKQKRLEKAKKALHFPDSVLEIDIINEVNEFLRCGGVPIEIVTAFSESYIGIPELTRFLFETCSSLGVAADQMSSNIYFSLKQLMVESFDPRLMDSKFVNLESSPEWLDELMKHRIWRSVIYELSEKHPKSFFLNFVIQKLSESGYQNEMKNISTASTYYNVFTSIFMDIMTAIQGADDDSIHIATKDLIKVCSQNENTYLLAEIILRSLLQDPKNHSLKRVIQDLESAVNRQFKRPPLASHLSNMVNSLSGDMASALSSIGPNINPSAGDVLAVFRSYKSPHPPSVEYIRRPEFMNCLLSLIFAPSSKSGPLRPELRDKYLWLISYASAAIPGSTGTAPEVEQNYQTLKALEKLLSKKPTRAELNNIASTVLQYIDIPIASIAVTLWIRYILHETAFYETYFRSTEIPIPHLLLEEIAYRHPLQHQIIFDVFVKSFETNITTLNVQTMMIIRRTVLDRMIYMMKIGYVLPILRYIASNASKIDESLTGHFCEKVLEIFSPPYPHKYIAHFLAILNHLSTDLIQSLYSKDHLSEFLDFALENKDYLSNASNSSLNKLKDLSVLS